MTYLFVQLTGRRIGWRRRSRRSSRRWTPDLGARPRAVGDPRRLHGLPRYALDDRDLIRATSPARRSCRSSACLPFGSRRSAVCADPLLAMAVLAFSALVTAGILLVPGHLTLVSAFFFSILFGLGIDFGVHLLDGAEELEAGGSTAAKR
ncbi:MAG: hypothetical protein R2862_11225 [Thermoanaerobaculia bacterium]